MYVCKCIPLNARLTLRSSRRTSWYKPEQTPGSVLGEVSASMEECRAEAVALFCKLAHWKTSEFGTDFFQVAGNEEVLEIFGVSD